ncbi:HNH endonuclease signature motif containing protein [Cryobacterium fucosi]|nr:HNH endonuclease signature motif containing protein [Cryobacterium fucosi]
MTASFLARQEGLGTRFEAIAETEREIAAAFARRAAQVDEARRYSEATAATRAVPGGRWPAGTVAEREFVSELAVTLRFPQRTAENLIEASRALAEDLPATRAALEAGEISYRHAQVLIGQALTVPAAAKAGFEAALLRTAGHLTVAKLKYKARLLRERLHPETILARHTISVADRKVGVDADADGMATLWLYDTAEKVNAAYHRVSVTVGSLQGPTEPRTLAQLRADVLTDLLLDGVTPAGLGAGIRATVNVTVPVLTLMGQSEEPGHLEGYGPIDPETARKLAGGAAGFTRLLTHPETGVVLSVGRDHYKVPEPLKNWLRLRDETCRFPGCNQPADRCDHDHSLDWQFDGLTAHDNLANLCGPCHALKSETGWTVKHLAGGFLEWTSPTGQSFTTEPATIIHTPPGTVATPPGPEPAPPDDTDPEPAPF